MYSEKQVSDSIASQPQQEDEISLLDITRLLFSRKKLILGVIAITFCVGLLYVFTQEKVYQVSTILSHPNAESILEFNFKNSENIKKSGAFLYFIKVVESRKFKKEFFDKYNLIEIFSNNSKQDLSTVDLNKIFEKFNSNLAISKDKEGKTSQVTLNGVHKDKIGSLLDDFVDFANQVAVDELVINLQIEMDYRIKKLTSKIENKRTDYKQEINDRISRLQEEYKIAESLGIEDHVLLIPRSSTDNKSAEIRSNGVEQVRRMLSISTTLSGYMKGTRALQAEINVLKNRKSDDIYIEGVRDLQRQLSSLEAISLVKGNLQVVTVDKKAAISVQRIGKDRKFTMILSLILGGILGIFSAFFMEFISKFNREVNNES